MRRILRALVIILALALAGLGVSALAFRNEMAIDADRGVAEAGMVRIGGIDQWVQIRGDDRTNPVLLILGGGPGFSTISATPVFREWERHFTVVMWDQRGEGRTFHAAGPQGSGEMSIDRMTRDGIELAEYLRLRLGQRKIVLLGFSWGSVLGVGMVQQRPDLFHAYVGTGQVTDEQAMMAASYPEVLVRARQSGNAEALAQLEAVGPPPWQPLEAAVPWFIWSNAFDPGEVAWPGGAGYPAMWIWRELEMRKEAAGTLFSQQSLVAELMTASVLQYGTDFAVPVIMVQGREDLAVMTPLVRAYATSLNAPAKGYFEIPGQGHAAMFRAPDQFLEILVEHVRPLAIED